MPTGFFNATEIRCSHIIIRAMRIILPLSISSKTHVAELPPLGAQGYLLSRIQHLGEGGNKLFRKSPKSETQN
jgi:hypothetical protein